MPKGSIRFCLSLLRCVDLATKLDHFHDIGELMIPIFTYFMATLGLEISSAWGQQALQFLEPVIVAVSSAT